MTRGKLMWYDYVSSKFKRIGVKMDLITDYWKQGKERTRNRESEMNDQRFSGNLKKIKPDCKKSREVSEVTGKLTPVAKKV